MSGPGVTEWDISNAGGTSSGDAFIGSCDGSVGLAIDDATSANGSGDAYDTAWQVFIDSQIFEAPDPVGITGNVMTAGPAMVGVANLPVTVEYLFSDTVQAARIRVLFENTSGNDINITVEVPVNFGSDAATTLEATSSGDLVFGIDDRWIVTSDGAPAGDAVNTTVIFGPDNPVELPTAVTNTVCDSSGTEGAGMTFEIKIPANSIRALMFFAGLGSIEGITNTIIGAINSAAMFDDTDNIDPSLIGDLDPTELDQILNWRFIREGKVKVSSGGGGGGCSLQAAAGPDPLLPALLAVLSLLFIYRYSGRRQR
ncbi:MAG: JDVT-CTERM domain-containing protein [Pseudomonadota bacterium]